MLLWNIFVLFTRVAVFSWGGGPASLALMQRETTSAGWISEAEFADAVALGNALPGPIAPQVSAYVGYRMAGVPGAVVAASGTVLPTTLLMLLMVIFFFGIKDSPAIRAMLAAVRPVVVGLLLWTAYDMARAVFAIQGTAWPMALVRGWDKVLISLGTFTLLTLTGINPALVILAAAMLGLLVYRGA
ncbi:MAG: chromate transporter [Anaerolineales bacterium]|jgi:chromate transporter